MLTDSWPCPGSGAEYALAFDRARTTRLLIVPALFDEANKLRRFTVEVMRLLDAAGIDSILPDLPGTNESLSPLADQTLASWRAALATAAAHYKVTGVLTMRAGALVAPVADRTCHYAPQSGEALLRALLRGQVISDREAGNATTREQLLETGRAQGIVLAGMPLGAAMVEQLCGAEPDSTPETLIAQSELDAPGLWLRAEPTHSQAQAEKLAALVQEWLA